MPKHPLQTNVLDILKAANDQICRSNPRTVIEDHFGNYLIRIPEQTSSSLVNLMFSSDLMQLISKIPNLDSPARIKFLHPLINGIAGQFARIKPNYKQYLNLTANLVPSFLKAFKEDKEPLGGAYTENYMPGMRLAYRYTNTEEKYHLRAFNAYKNAIVELLRLIYFVDNYSMADWKYHLSVINLLEIAYFRNPSQINLSTKKKISKKEAMKLLEEESYIDLQMLESITPEIAEILAKGDCTLNLSGLKNLDTDCARELGEKKEGKIILDGLSELKLDAAKRLAKCEIELSLAGLKDAPTEILKTLGAGKIETLYLDGFTKITPNLCKSLASFDFKNIYLRGVETLSETDLKSLKGIESNSNLYFERVTTLTPKIARHIRDADLTFDFPCIKQLDDATAWEIARWGISNIGVYTPLSNAAINAFVKSEKCIKLHFHFEMPLETITTIEKLNRKSFQFLFLKDLKQGVDYDHYQSLPDFVIKPSLPENTPNPFLKPSELIDDESSSSDPNSDYEEDLSDDDLIDEEPSDSDSDNIEDFGIEEEDHEEELSDDNDNDDDNSSSDSDHDEEVDAEEDGEVIHQDLEKLTDSPEDLAIARKIITKDEDELFFVCLVHLSAKAAEILASFPGGLTFMNLQKLPLPVVKALAKHEGPLQLSNLGKMTDEIAEALSHHQGNLLINNFSTLSDNAAEHLSRHRGNIDLLGLRKISAKGASALTKVKGDLLLSPENLSAEVRKILAEKISGYGSDAEEDEDLIDDNEDLSSGSDSDSEYNEDSDSDHEEEINDDDDDSSSGSEYSGDYDSSSGSDSDSAYNEDSDSDHEEEINDDDDDSNSDSDHDEVLNEDEDEDEEISGYGDSESDSEYNDDDSDYEEEISDDDDEDDDDSSSDSDSEYSDDDNTKEAEAAKILVLDESSARALVEKSKGQEIEIELNDLVTLSPAVASILITHDDKLSLNQLADVSDEVADILANYPQGLSMNGLVRLEHARLAEKLAGDYHDTSIFLWDLEVLSNDAANALGKFSQNKFVKLSALPFLTPEIATSLLAVKGGLELLGLKTITPEVAEILGGYKSRLSLGLKFVSPGVTRGLARCLGSLSLRSLKFISSDDAKELANHKGNHLDLGIKVIDVETASALALHQGGTLELDLLEISEEVAKVFYEKHDHELRLNNEIKFQSDAALKWLALKSINYDLLNEPNDEIKSRGKQIIKSVKGICKKEALSIEEASELALYPKSKIFNSVKDLSLDVAKILSRGKGRLDFPAIESLAEPLAELLGQNLGGLSLNGLKTLSPVVAQLLSKSAKSLELNGLNVITQQVAACLSNFKGKLILDGLENLGTDVARELKSHQGELSLKGLKFISDQAALDLAHHSSKVDLSGVINLSEKAQDAWATRLNLPGRDWKVLDELKGLCSVSSAALGKWIADDEGNNQSIIEITTEAAKGMARSTKTLELEGIKSLPLELALEFVNFRGDLSLNGILELSDENAKVLSKFQGRKLEFENLEVLSPEGAKWLAKYRGELELPEQYANLIYESKTLLEKALEKVRKWKINHFNRIIIDDNYDEQYYDADDTANAVAFSVNLDLTEATHGEFALILANEKASSTPRLDLESVAEAERMLCRNYLDFNQSNINSKLAIFFLMQDLSESNATSIVATIKNLLKEMIKHEPEYTFSGQGMESFVSNYKEYDPSSPEEEETHSSDNSESPGQMLKKACKAGDIQKIIELRQKGASFYTCYAEFKEFEQGTISRQGNHQVYSRQFAFDDAPLAIPFADILKVVGPIYGGASFSIGERPKGWARAAAENRILSLSDHGFVVSGDQIVDIDSRYITTNPIPVPWNTIMVGSMEELESGTLPEIHATFEIPQELQDLSWAKYGVDEKEFSDDDANRVAGIYICLRRDLFLKRNYAEFREVQDLFIAGILGSPQAEIRPFLMLLKYFADPSSNENDELFVKAKNNGLNQKGIFLWELLTWRVDIFYTERDEDKIKEWDNTLKTRDFESFGPRCAALGHLIKYYHQILLNNNKPDLAYLRNFKEFIRPKDWDLFSYLIEIIAERYCDLILDEGSDEENELAFPELISLGLLEYDDGIIGRLVTIIKEGKTDLLRAYLQRGLNPVGRVTAGNNYVPLATSLMNEPNIEIVELLLAHGANPYEVTHFAQNSFDLAKENLDPENETHAKLINLLEKYRVNAHIFPGLVLLPSVNTNGIFSGIGMGDENNNEDDNDDSASDHDEDEEDNVEQEVAEDPALEKPFVSLRDEAKEKEFQEKRLALIQAMLGTDAQLVQNLRDLNHRIWKAGFQISETRPFACGEIAPGYLLSNRVDPDVCLFAISLEKLFTVAGSIAKVEIPTDDFNPKYPEGYFRALRENRVFTLTSDGIGLCGHHWYSTQNAEYFVTTNSLTEYSSHVIYIPEKESLDAQLVDYATFPETIKKPLIEKFGLKDLSFDTLEFHAFLVKLVIEFEDQELKGSALDFKEREEVFNHLAIGRSDNPLVSFVQNSLLKKFPDVRIAKEIETILPGPIGTLAAIFQACVRLACLVQNAETLLEESYEDESKEVANHKAMFKLTLDADAILSGTDVLLEKLDTQNSAAFKRILEIYCQLTGMKTPDSFQILIDLNKPWKAGEDPIAYAVLYRMRKDAAMELFFQAPAENDIISVDNIMGVIKSGFVPNIRQILGLDPRVDALWLNRGYRLREYGPEFYFSIFEMLYLKENIPYPDDDDFDAEHLATFSRGAWNLENATLALAKGANPLEQDDSGMCILDILQRHIMVASSQKNEADTQRRKDLQLILIRHVAGSGRPMPLNTTNKVLKEIATLLGKNDITAAEMDKLPAATKNKLLEISNVALRVYPQMREWVEKYLIGRLWIALKNTSEGGANLNPDYPTAMRIGASIDKYYQDLAAATLGTPDATKYLDMLNRENFFSLLDDRTLKLRVLNSNFEDWPRMARAGALIKQFYEKAEVLLIFGAPLEDENMPTATTTLATLDPEIKAEYPTIHRQLSELDPTSPWVGILDCMIAVMNHDESPGSLQVISKKLEALKAKLGLKTGIFNPYYHFLASQYHRLGNDWNASLEAFSRGVRLASCSFKHMEKVIVQHITKIHLGEFIRDDANGDWEQTDEDGMKKFLAALESVIKKYPAESNPSITDWFAIRAQLAENLEMYDPSKAISLYNQAGSYAKTKKKEAAYSEAFKLDPFFFWSANNIAWHFAARSDKPYLRDGTKAVAWAEKTLTQLKTNSWSAWDTLAAAHAANGEFEKALNAIKQAKKYAPTSELDACDILYDRYSQGLSHFDPEKLLEDRTLSKLLANKKLAKLLGLYDGRSSITNSLGMTFGKIFPAEFTMGGKENEEGFDEEEFRHRVRITKPYFLGKYAVTQHCWEKIMGDNPSKHKAVDYPVSQISWEQANDFCTRLSNLPEEQQAQRSYRLPTEAEWEYACRAGSTEAYSTGGYLSEDEARFSDEWGSVAKPPVQVGTLPPNNFGFYEMHGNVWEWCSDWFDEEYYKNSPLEDPQGPETGDHHTLRGGSASVQNYECRAATRGEAEQDKPSKDSGKRFAFIGDFGLRVVCIVKDQQ